MQSVQLQSSFLKFAFPSIWRMSSEYSTKQHTFAQLSSKQMSKIWYKNIHAFLRYRNSHVGTFRFTLQVSDGRRRRNNNDCLTASLRNILCTQSSELQATYTELLQPTVWHTKTLISAATPSARNWLKLQDRRHKGQCIASCDYLAVSFCQ